jgi:hypothetical protein
MITDRLFAVYLEQLCVEDADTSFTLDKKHTTLSRTNLMEFVFCSKFVKSPLVCRSALSIDTFVGCTVPFHSTVNDMFWSCTPPPEYFAMR